MVRESNLLRGFSAFLFFESALHTWIFLDVSKKVGKLDENFA